MKINNNNNNGDSYGPKEVNDIEKKNGKEGEGEGGSSSDDSGGSSSESENDNNNENEKMDTENVDNGCQRSSSQSSNAMDDDTEISHKNNNGN